MYLDFLWTERPEISTRSGRGPELEVRLSVKTSVLKRHRDHVGS